MVRLIGLFLILGLVLPIPCAARDMIDLSGQWEFAADAKDVGKAEEWFKPEVEFDKKITVPGAWNTQGIGEPSESLFSGFAGPGWYRRQVSVPQSWQGKEMYLCLDGVYKSADIWVNGEHLGTHTDYLTQFRVEIAYLIIKNWTIDIVIRVDGRRSPDSDRLYGAMDLIGLSSAEWGGITGRVWLETTEKSWIENAYVKTRTGSDVLEVIVETQSRILYGGSAEQQPEFILQADIYDHAGKHVGSNVSYKMLPAMLPDFIMADIENPTRWTPQSPYLYSLDVRLYKEDVELDYYTTKFGIRDFTAEGDKFFLNGKPVFLRGYIDDCIFPNTIAPPVDKNVFKERFKTAKDYGFNFVRCRSWEPPKEYLDAADEVGILVQIDLPTSQPRSSRANPSPELDQYYQDQWQNMIKPRRSHPSIIAWGMFDDGPANRSLFSEMYATAKRIDSARLLVDNNNNPLPKADEKPGVTLDFLPVKFSDRPEIGLGGKKYDLGGWRPAKPVIINELGRFGTLPNLDQRKLFSRGVRPYWLFSQQAIADHNGIADQLDKWVECSNKLQAAALKSEIESARLAGDIRGYALSSLQDRWAESYGVLDAFFRAKGAAADEFSKFNAASVLLMETDRRSYRAGETAEASIYVSRYEDAPLSDAVLAWKLLDGEITIASGEIKNLKVDSEGLQTLTRVDVKMPAQTAARKLTLVAELEGGGSSVDNSWNFWVFPADYAKIDSSVCIAGIPLLSEMYPDAKAMDANSDSIDCSLLIASELSAAALDYLEKGGSVLLLGPAASLPVLPSSYVPYIGSGNADKDSNAGTIIDTSHPAMQEMPAQDWCDLMYYNLLTDSRAVNLTALASGIAPIIRCLDLPSQLRSKAYLFEANVGKGRLLVAAMNVQGALEKSDPAAGYFVDRLIKYATGSNFKPAAECEAQQLRKLVSGS